MRKQKSESFNRVICWYFFTDRSDPEAQVVNICFVLHSNVDIACLTGPLPSQLGDQDIGRAESASFPARGSGHWESWIHHCKTADQQQIKAREACGLFYPGHIRVKTNILNSW